MQNRSDNRIPKGRKPVVGKSAGVRNAKSQSSQYTAGQPSIDTYTKSKTAGVQPGFKRSFKNEYMCYSINLHEFLKKNNLKTIREMRHPKTGRTAFIYQKDEKLNRFLEQWTQNQTEVDSGEPIDRWIIKEDKGEAKRAIKSEKKPVAINKKHRMK